MGLPEAPKRCEVGWMPLHSAGREKGPDADLGVRARSLMCALPRPAAAPHTTLMRGAARLPGAFTRKP